MHDGQKPDTGMVLTIETARDIFEQLLRNPRDGEARQLVRSQPEAALACLQSVDGLSASKAGAVFEIILGDQPDARGAEMVREHLTVPRAAELVVVRGDLDSVAAGVVDPEVLLQALSMQMLQRQDPNDLEIVRRWAFRAKDRPDFEQICGLQFQRRQVQMWIVAAVAQHFETEGEIPLSAWEEVGLDWDVANGLLAQLLEQPLRDDWSDVMAPVEDLDHGEDGEEGEEVRQAGPASTNPQSQGQPLGKEEDDGSAPRPTDEIDL